MLHCSGGKMGKQRLNLTPRKHWIFTSSEKSVNQYFLLSHYTSSVPILPCGSYCYACLWVSENHQNSSHCACPSEVIILIPIDSIPLVSCLSFLEPIISRTVCHFLEPLLSRTRGSFQKNFKCLQTLFIEQLTNMSKKWTSLSSKNKIFFIMCSPSVH